MRKNATLRPWSIRLLAVILPLTLVACRDSGDNTQSEDANQDAVAIAFNIDNTVDYVIAGDANSAALGFAFPLHHGGFHPLMKIQNKADFIRLFPILFDKGVREKLKQMQQEEGWGFRNWQGEMFGNGAFWRENPEWSSDKRIHTVQITGEEFDKYYQEVYAKDKMNLAPQYRVDMAWIYAYFAAEDDSFYGRVDALGRDERKVRGPVSDRYRIMIFRSGQKPNEEPSEMYFCKDSPEDGIVSEDGLVKFKIERHGDGESPWGWLEYPKDKARGNNGYVRLKADTPWLEKYKAD